MLDEPPGPGSGVRIGRALVRVEVDVGEREASGIASVGDRPETSRRDAVRGLERVGRADGRRVAKRRRVGGADDRRERSAPDASLARAPGRLVLRRGGVGRQLHVASAARVARLYPIRALRRRASGRGAGTARDTIGTHGELGRALARR